MNVNKLLDSISFNQISAAAVLLSAGIGIQIFKSHRARKWIRILMLITTLGVPFAALLMLAAFALAKLKVKRKQLLPDRRRQIDVRRQLQRGSGYDTD